MLIFSAQSAGIFFLPFSTAERKEDVTEYTIENGENLKLGQTEIIINYRGKEASQAITVKKNSLSKIEVKTPPTKTTYFEGEDFDKTGMVILATYEKGNTQEITDYAIENGTNLKLEQKAVTISYEEKTTTQAITVKEKPVDKAENSDFSNAKAIVKKVQIYYYSSNNKDDYSNIEVEVNNIQKNSGNDKNEYYYCLSSLQELMGVDEEDFVKIENGEIIDGKLTFNINTKDVNNYSEISNSDVVYLYIKEVATKGQDKKIFQTESMKLDSSNNIEMYVDDKKVDNNNNQNVPPSDPTVADKDLPDTGAKVITVIIIAILLFAGIKFVKYIKLKDIK